MYIVSYKARLIKTTEGHCSLYSSVNGWVTYVDGGDRYSWMERGAVTPVGA